MTPAASMTAYSRPTKTSVLNSLHELAGSWAQFFTGAFQTREKEGREVPASRRPATRRPSDVHAHHEHGLKLNFRQPKVHHHHTLLLFGG